MTRRRRNNTQNTLPQPATYQGTTQQNGVTQQRRIIKKEPLVNPTVRTVLSGITTTGSMASLALSPIKALWAGITGASISLVALSLGQVVAFIGNSKKREILKQKKNDFDGLNYSVSDAQKRELEANSFIDEIGLATIPSEACKDCCNCGPICNCFGGYAGHPEDNYSTSSTAGFVLSCLTTGTVTALNGASTACTITAAALGDENPHYKGQGKIIKMF